MAEATPLDSDVGANESGELRSSGSDAFLRELADTGGRGVAVEMARGERIDRFRIESVIGRGGMGVVYDAHDERLDRRVALKLLHSHLVGHTERKLRFAREAKAAAAITHPNVARILEVGDGESGTYLVFEKVEGRTLRALLRDGPLSIAMLSRLGARIASALAAAHAAGVVHRDLKPENVLVDAQGEVKVLDFGLAKTHEMDAAGVPSGEVLTTEGVVLGSPGYMSPEQALGKVTTKASDVFSLGVLLFELATGARPFKGATPMESIVATTRDVAPDLHELRRDLPRTFVGLVARCLDKDPTLRPSAVDVEAVLETMPREGASKSPRRGLVVAGVALVVVLGGVLVRRMPAPEATRAAPASTPTIAREPPPQPSPIRTSDPEPSADRELAAAPATTASAVLPEPAPRARVVTGHRPSATASAVSPPPTASPSASPGKPLDAPSFAERK